MPKRRDIAMEIGVSQVAISLALRGDVSISASLRKRIRAAAKRLGYRPNPYGSALMSHIRAGRKPSEKGVLALLVDVYSRQDWHKHESYRVYFQGLSRRCAELGFRVEAFFLTDPT